ncbi:hypothetical protein [Polynucleobacter sp. MWH-HuK1]|uniref:hypothetical protein n=1 Tax=Polynucleobacter sp. MWH-HuK1 TaxID=1743158 RepID=UPI001C0C3DCF|nr:hypothetical protein [Polynucleobacter sp. MWH-HuK1]MBU3564436.1 hypothetical protein [Polynucleobacter sp. MWH-HuK1]
MTVLAVLIAVYKLGFKEAVNQITSEPERLRDVTFRIWDNYDPSNHGFLVFYSLEDFKKNIAYSNHSTAYLLYMYVLYKIEMLIPAFQMRVVSALINMLSLAGAVFYIIANITKKSISLNKGFLVLLSVIFMLSMPGYWISVARFNVDNAFPLIFTILVLLAFFIWKDKGGGKRVWGSLLLFAIFSPISTVVTGLALYLYSFRYDGLNIKLFKLASVSVLIGCVFYLQAPILLKILGFTSSNSGWLFRSGLDGNSAYFSNAFLSVVSPHFPRPLHIIAIPILLLLAQVVYSRSAAGIAKLEGEDRDEGMTSSGMEVFNFLIFSQYIFTLLLWPQAISIHPYLYDYIFLAPTSVLIILNFLNFPGHFYLLRLWVLILLFLISFNFQQIAQSKCDGCYYPAWGASN